MKKAFMLGSLFVIGSVASIHAQGGNDSNVNNSTRECSITLFDASPAQVSSGGSSMLNWITSNCTNVTIIGGNLSGYRPLSGNLNTGPLTGTTTFTLTAASTTSTATRTLTLSVAPDATIPPPPPPAVTTTTTTTPLPVPPPAATTTTVTTTIATPSATPPPPPPPPPPAATTTTVTSNTSTTPVYDVDPLPSAHVSRLRFGAYLAPTLSWMRPTASTDDQNQFNVESDGSKIGFTYGLMGEYFFAPNYGIVSGIQINQTGGKIIATNKDQSIQSEKVLKADFNYHLQFVEIPLALKLRTDNITGFRFFGQLGASIAINIGKKADYTVLSVPKNATAAFDTSGTKIKLTGSIGHIAPILFQMNIGAGAEYPISNKLTFYVGLFFNNGFAPDATKPHLFDNDKLGYGGDFRDANTRLNNMALRVGLFF